MRTPLILLAVGLLLSACSSTPEVTSTYLLRSEKSLETRQLSGGGALMLSSLKVADYIDQPGLVLEMGDGTIHIARYNKWAEPLRLSLREFLCAEMSAQLGYDVVDSGRVSANGKPVDITITRLHGDADGNAVLSATWTVGKDEQVEAFQFAETAPLEGTGYDALVVAQKKLLIDLAQAIAAGVR